MIIPMFLTSYHCIITMNMPVQFIFKNHYCHVDIDAIDIGINLDSLEPIKLCAFVDIADRVHLSDVNRSGIFDVLIDRHDCTHHHNPCSHIHGRKCLLRLSFRSLSSRIAPRTIFPGGSRNSTGLGICRFHFGGLDTSGCQWFGEWDHGHGFVVV